MPFHINGVFFSQSAFYIQTLLKFLVKAMTELKLKAFIVRRITISMLYCTFLYISSLLHNCIIDILLLPL